MTEYDKFKNMAIEVAKKAHAGQTDKGGEPYFFHVQQVANSLTDKNAKVVAYLHDTVEDTDITIEKLKELKKNGIIDDEEYKLMLKSLF